MAVQVAFLVQFSDSTIVGPARKQVLAIYYRIERILFSLIFPKPQILHLGYENWH